MNRFMEEFQNLFKVFKDLGGNKEILRSPGFSFLFVNKNKVLNKNIGSKGVEVTTKEKEDGVDVNLRIRKGYKILQPIYLCFGILHKKGLQNINANFIVEDNVKAKILSHCVFPEAEKVTHRMQTRLFIGKNSEIEYDEIHFHGKYGGAEVSAYLEGEISKNSKMKSEFSLVEGCVGKLKIDYTLSLKDNSICELLAKVYGKKEDKIDIKESINLNGDYSKGLAKSRIVIKDEAVSVVTGKIIANAPYSRGHVDCKEIIQDKGKASAYPLVSATNSKARVTHEAAIGSIDKMQIQTLMSKGLSESEAVDIIIKGILT